MGIGVTKPIEQRIYGSDGSTKKIAVAGHSPTTVRSYHFELGKASAFAIKWNAESSGTVAVNLSVEIGDKKPDVEGTSDPQIVVPSGIGVTAAISSTGFDRTGFVPTLGNYAVLLLESDTNNDATTTIEPWVILEFGG